MMNDSFAIAILARAYMFSHFEQIELNDSSSSLHEVLPTTTSNREWIVDTGAT